MLSVKFMEYYRAIHIFFDIIGSYASSGGDCC